MTLYSEKRGSQLNKNNSQNYRIHKKHSTAAPPEKSYGVESFQLSFLMAGFLFRFVIFNLQQALRFDEKLCEISCKTKDRFFPFKKRIFPVSATFSGEFPLISQKDFVFHRKWENRILLSDPIQLESIKDFSILST